MTTEPSIRQPTALSRRAPSFMQIFVVTLALLNPHRC